MPRATIDAAELHYEVRGEGLPVLLIMAATGNLGHFESLASCWPTSTRSSATTDAATDAVPPPGPHSPYDGQPHPVGADTRAVYEVSVFKVAL